jgi:hypothetical protein
VKGFQGSLVAVMMNVRRHDGVCVVYIQQMMVAALVMRVWRVVNIMIDDWVWLSVHGSLR